MTKKNILTALLLLWMAVPTMAQAEDNNEDEPKLVRVEYRKDWYWKEAEYNLPLRYYPIVYRDRTYETGETFTDTFQDLGHVGGYGCVFPSTWRGWDRSEYTGEDINGERIVFYPWNYETWTDLYYTSNYGGLGSYDVYVTSKSYDGMGLDVPPTEGVEFVGSSGTSTRPTGWYFHDCQEYHEFSYGGGNYGRLFDSWINYVFYDQYLVIDGQMISFNELSLRGTIHFNQSERDVYLPGNIPAKIFTHEARRTLLGRDFYGYAIDTVFQYTG